MTGWDDAGISISQIAEKLGLALGFTGSQATFIGGLLFGVILLLGALIPTAFLLRKASAAYMFIMIVGVSMVGVNVAMGLFPWWMLLVIAMLIALMFSGAVRGWITGRSGTE